MAREAAACMTRCSGGVWRAVVFRPYLPSLFSVLSTVYFLSVFRLLSVRYFFFVSVMWACFALVAPGEAPAQEAPPPTPESVRPSPSPSSPRAPEHSYFIGTSLENNSPSPLGGAGVEKEESRAFRLAYDNYFNPQWSWGLSFLYARTAYQTRQIYGAGSSPAAYSFESNLGSTAVTESNRVKVEYRVLGANISRRFALTPNSILKIGPGFVAFGRTSDASTLDGDDAFGKLAFGWNIGIGLVHYFNPALGLSADLVHYDLGDADYTYVGVGLVLNPLSFYDEFLAED